MVALAPPEQKFSIDPTQDNFIKGDQGSRIFIPVNAFVLEDGSVPEGKISVFLKEFYSVSDFISEGLSTISDGYLLETGGMLYITAKAGEKKLLLNKTSSLTIAFPKKDSTKKMETFYGDTTSRTVNWSRGFGGGSEGDGMAGLDTTLIDSSMFETKTRVCGYIYSSSLDSSSFIVEWKLKHPDSTIFLYVERNFPTDDSAVINALCKQGLMPHMDLYLDSHGKAIKIDFDKEHYYTVKTPAYLQKYLIAFFKSLPPFDMKSMKTHEPGGKYDLTFCCHKSLNTEEYDRGFKQKYSQYLDKTVENMGREALNYYIISSGRLGWINCDRFLYDSTEKIEYIVKFPGANDSKVMIVFDDIKSIMNGEIKNNEAVFRNVPVSSKIKVIGITYRDGQPLLSKMPAVVTKQSLTLSGFKEFTLNELEKELNN